jgi:hypothetical protein
MSGPDFFDLVGDEGTPEELERLHRAHDMLIVAGPPPELSPRLAEAPSMRTRSRSAWVPGRRRGAAFLLAAGLVAAAFGIGFFVGDRGSGSGEFAAIGSPVVMHSPAGSGAEAARASMLIGERDQVGNWPLLLRVSGLEPLPKGQWYELYLTRGGKLSAWCGVFSVKDRGRTSVQFSVPYSLNGDVGWVVVTGKERAKPRQVLLTT